MPTGQTTTAGASPESASRIFASAIASGDLRAALARFRADGCVITPDRTTIVGHEDIVVFLRQLLLVHPQIEIESGGVLAAGGVAVCSQRWRVSSKGPDDQLIEQTLPARLILKSDGRQWRVLVAAPWGL